MAKLQITIDPPTQGAAQAEKDFQRVGVAAEKTHQKIAAGGEASKKSLESISGGAAKTAGGMDGLTNAVTRNAQSLQFLLRSGAPLGVQMQQLNVSTGQMVTQQQILNAAYQEGKISAATMAAATARVAQTMQAAQAATVAYSLAQAELLKVQATLRQEQLLVAQRRLDLINARAVGEAKGIALAERDLQVAFAGQQQALIATRAATAAVIPLKHTMTAATREMTAAMELEAKAAMATNLAMKATGATVQLSPGVWRTATGAIIRDTNLMTAVQTKSASELAAIRERNAQLERDFAARFTQTTNQTLRNNQTQARSAQETANAMLASYRARQAAAAAAAAREAELAKVMSTLSNASQSVVGAMATQIKHLALLAAGYFTVHEAVKTFTEALHHAAELQAQRTTFRLTATQIEEVTETLHELDEVGRQLKLFDDAQLIKTASFLQTIGIATQNTGTYVQGLGVLAAKAGSDLDTMARAWQQAMLGRIMNPTLETKIILQQLAETTGRSMETIKKDVTSGTITAKDFTQALIDASTKTEILAARQADYSSKVKILRVAWLQMQEDFAMPIIDVLSPILDRLTTKMNNGKSTAEEWGETLAKAIDKVAYALGNMEKIWNALKDFNPFLPKMQGGGGKTDMLSGLPEGYTQLWPPPPSPLLDVLPPAPPLPSVRPPSRVDQALDEILQRTLRGGAGESDFEKWKSDVHMLTEFWEDYNLIQQTAASSTENHNRVLDLTAKTIKGLANPMESVKALMPYLSPDDQQIAQWMAWREASDRAMKYVELRMQSGVATLEESFRSGLQKMSDAWGTWQTQASNAAGEIGNALASGISSGLVEIINVTGLTAQSFKDMALSIIEDIQRIILQMIIQLAIQQALRATGLGAAAGGGNYLGIPGLTMAGGAQSGGPITGGSGARDDVPIMAMGGEFMFTKKATQNIGMENLYTWMHAAEKGWKPRGYALGNMVSGREKISHSYEPGYYEYLGALFGSYGSGTSGFSDYSGAGLATSNLFGSSGVWGGPGSYIPAGSPWGNVIGTTVGRSGYLTVVPVGGSYSSGYGMSISGALMGPDYGAGYSGLGSLGFTSVGRGYYGATTSTGDYKLPIFGPYALGGYIPSFQGGGTMPHTGLAYLHAGEDVTPAGRSGATVVNINIDRRGSASTSSSGGRSGGDLDENDGRKIARYVESMIDAKIGKETRVGGSLYIPRAGRG